jgi:hypothetical protein
MPASRESSICLTAGPTRCWCGLGVAAAVLGTWAVKQQKRRFDPAVHHHLRYAIAHLDGGAEGAFPEPAPKARGWDRSRRDSVGPEGRRSRRGSRSGGTHAGFYRNDVHRWPRSFLARGRSLAERGMGVKVMSISRGAASRCLGHRLVRLPAPLRSAARAAMMFGYGLESPPGKR